LVAATGVVFDGRAVAGDLVSLRAEKTATMGALVRFSVAARVGEKVIARGEMTFAVTVAPSPSQRPDAFSCGGRTTMKWTLGLLLLGAVGCGGQQTRMVASPETGCPATYAS